MIRGITSLLAVLSLLLSGCSNDGGHPIVPTPASATPTGPRLLSLPEVEASPPGGTDGTISGHWQRFWSTLAFDYRDDLVIGTDGSVFAAEYTLPPHNEPIQPTDITMTGTLAGEVVTVVNAQGYWTDTSNYRVTPLGPDTTFTARLEQHPDEPYLLTTGFVHDAKKNTDANVPWCNSNVAAVSYLDCLG